ncbi:tRNA (adenosine(37)-N6)-threonylcarbamoyltransferase complex dimerization subunit type 1 TsaB [Klenkia taihuensis]|uniref:tRNA threonylcarbamoyl adenosine modification protein YeaZ n=1 Tax=Klenkia taihuensis TaxID=1225127 RepID=A0A1I1JLW6_9ACTN|nr:tRNA (adenosine(37)-N6)-threonylcarbamoyltransferase complex dimerization subunit type 1 TsaB [Klenkia taihuensis]GHE10824.1 tRNA (adenosine(37)-N6)-threonylcarbamoyltransferase complex dimerization subunit type 1 TsaB [Klenkia taihuensis]SFC49577.1 tRNA threonylcarbamoyl adenosine modification protein YeaZ [Klenkia taihuensis]
MLTLAIDTATPTLVVGVADGDRVLAEAGVPSGTRHAELLTPTVTDVLARAGVAVADLARLVVGLGPGPYTGLRVGIVTAAALGDVVGVPVHGVCSLDAVGEGPRVVVTDARRKEVYWRAYDGGPLGGPDVGRPEELDLPDLPVVGDARFAERLGREVAPAEVTTAGLLRAVPAGEPAPLTPLYLRRPDAVPNVVRKPVTR